MRGGEVVLMEQSNFPVGHYDAKIILAAYRFYWLYFSYLHITVKVVDIYWKSGVFQ